MRAELMVQVVAAEPAAVLMLQASVLGALLWLSFVLFVMLSCLS